MWPDLTPWSLLSALSLSGCTFACARWGDMRDMRAPLIFLIAYYVPYQVAAGPLPSGILALIAGHTLLAWGFYQLSERWYGDAAGIIYALAAMLGLAAAFGALPSETGQGIAHNYWHYLACCNHAQNILVGGGCYARFKELA